MASATTALRVATGEPFTVRRGDPGSVALAGKRLGARIEAPRTHAIVSAWQEAVLDGAEYKVTLDAPLENGLWRLVWRTADDPPAWQDVDPLLTDSALSSTVSSADYPPVDVEQVTPSVDEVAAIERDRTRNSTDEDTGTFTDDTSPTDAEVEGLIETATQAVLSEMVEAFPPIHYPQVKHLIRLYTAMLIEGSYYREQASNRADLWQSLYTDGITRLNAKIDQDVQQQLRREGLESWRPPQPAAGQGWTSWA